MVKPSHSFLITLIATATVLLQSCSVNTSRNAEQEEAFAAIERFNRMYLQAINEGDVELLSSLTTDDYVMIPEDGDPLTGKQTLVDTMRDTFERFEIDETWTPVETIVNGDVAFQRGTYTVLARPRGEGEITESSGSFHHTYQRQDNGQWLM